MKFASFRELVAIGFAASVLGAATGGCDSDENVVNGPRATVCAGGSSVSCTDPFGCIGAQLCNFEGTGYGPCQCGAAPPTDSGTAPDPDASVADAGGGDGARAITAGGLRVQWTLTQGGSPVDCASVGTGLRVVLTPAAGAAINRPFACAATSDVVGIPVGTYTVTADVVDAGGQARGSGGPYTVESKLTPCDAVVGDSCLSALAVTIAIPQN